MSIDPILREWFWRIKQIQDIDDQETVAFGNVSLAVERFQELAEFLQAYLPTMRQWTMNYLDKNRSEILIRYCDENLSSKEHTTSQDWEPPRSTEERDPFPYEKLGQTLIQRFRGMLPILISGWSLSDQYEKDPYKQFFQLWRKLDGIMGVIQNDLPILITLE